LCSCSFYFVEPAVGYQRKDKLYSRAKREGYRSRAAYKLLELDQRLGLIKSGMRVVDLGCAPGGWMQVAATKVGKRGFVVGIDRFPMEPVDGNHACALVADVSDDGTKGAILEKLCGPADVVLSDMAPDTTGVGFADHANSLELTRLATELAAELLGPGGALVAKVFDGPDLNEFMEQMRKDFGKVRRLRLKSTRKGSSELYLHARKQRRREHESGKRA